MKYRTFARLRAAVAAFAVAGAAFVGCRAVGGPQSPPDAVPVAEGNKVPSASVPDPVTLSRDDERGGQKIDDSTVPSNSKQGKPPKPQAGSIGLTTWQSEVIDMQKQPLSNGVVKNGNRKLVVDGGGMHAEFRNDADKGATGWNRVKIDLNGNKRDDERWDFKPDGSIKRRVAPNDDENFTEEYKLQGNKWVKKGGK